MAAWAWGAGSAATVLGGVVGLWLLLPDRAHVSRSAEIAAPQATVFELLDDAAAVRRWSPRRDPTARYLFSGPALGLGARMDWTGREPGSEVIRSARPYDAVTYSLDFAGRPGRAEFRLSPNRGGVKVDWRLERTAGWSLGERWRLLLFRAQTGPELERGLDRLAETAEALPRADLAAAHVRLANRAGGRAAAEVVEATGVGDDAQPALAATRLFMGVHRLISAGEPWIERTADPAVSLVVSPVRGAAR